MAQTPRQAVKVMSSDSNQQQLTFEVEFTNRLFLIYKGQISFVCQTISELFKKLGVLIIVMKLLLACLECFKCNNVW